MTNKFKNAWEAIKDMNNHKKDWAYMELTSDHEYNRANEELHKGNTPGDTRYTKPKTEHGVSMEEINEVLAS